MYKLASSSLSRAHKTLCIAEQNHISQYCYAFGVLSLNHKYQSKRAQTFLDGELAHRNDIIICHDLINNSISKHNSNNDTALTEFELRNILLYYKSKIAAIVYCQRVETPKIYDLLCSTGILNLSVTGDLISKRKQKDTRFLRQYFQIHQETDLELKSFSIVRSNTANLKKIKNKKSGPLKKTSCRTQSPPSCRICSKEPLIFFVVSMYFNL